MPSLCVQGSLFLVEELQEVRFLLVRVVERGLEQVVVLRILLPLVPTSGFLLVVVASLYAPSWEIHRQVLMCVQTCENT